MDIKRVYLSEESLQQSLKLPDLTGAGIPPNAIRMMVETILEGLVERGWPAHEMHLGERVVSAQENYGLLGYSSDEITLGGEHTRWVSDSHLLRTQTTSQIPAALQRAAERRRSDESILLAAPGITFRRDTRDRWHCAEPHQMDIWVLGGPELGTHKNLLRLIADILDVAVPGMAWVDSPSPHHYTDGGIEVNLLQSGQPIEVLECGLIAHSLLRRLQIDPQQHGGLALGMGLDRLTMLRKGIPDIRLLRDPEPRVQAQMHDLKPWKAVSRLPSIARDISLAVEPGQSEEALTEKMLLAAGERASWIEEMQVKGRWPVESLPTQVVARLGLLPGQENVLLGVVLRDSSRSITAEEANDLYQCLQTALHEGVPGAGYRMDVKP